MAIPRDADLVKLGPWPRGGNNIARQDSIPNGHYRRGVNVDVYPGGKLRRRRGKTPLITGIAASDLWSDGHFALVKTALTLNQFIPGKPLVPLYAGLLLEADLTYCSVNDAVYVSDGTTALNVNKITGQVRPWGVQTPAGQPHLSIVSGGLDAGSYQVAITYCTASGEESGTKLSAQIVLPDSNSGIRARLPALPGVDASITNINLYVTRCGGEVEFRFYGSYPVGALDVTISRQNLGRQLETFGLEPMPAGSAAGLVGGRLFVVVDNLLIWSEPGRYGLTNLMKNHIAYGGNIDMFAPTSLGAAASGLFVAFANTTVFLQGEDIVTSVNRLAYGSGAVRGAPVYINGQEFAIQNFPNSPMPVWVAKNGQPVVGLPDGSVMSLTNSRYEMRTGDRATIQQRELAGINQMIISMRSPGSGSVGTTGDAADAILIRNGAPV